MNINVILTASATGFNRAMQAARGGVNRFGRALTSTRSLVTGFGAALAGLAGAGSLAELVRGSLDSVDALAKTSDKLGVATEELTRLHHAAELSGVGAKTFDTALQRMTRRLSEAAQGGGVASGALRELGLDAEKLGRVSPDQALREIADGLDKVESQSDKVRLAFKFFDSEGVALVNTLRGGSAALDAAATDADKLGLSVSRIDAAKIEMANDAWSRMGGLVTGLGNQLAVELAPFLTAIADKFVDVATEGDGMSSIVSGGLEIVSKSIAFVADMWDALHIAFLWVQKGVTAGLSLFIKGLDKLGEGIRWVAGLLGMEIEPGGFLGNFADDLDRTVEEMDQKLTKKLVDRSSGEKITKFFDDIRREADKAAKEIADAVEKNPVSLNVDADATAKSIDASFDPGRAIWEQTRSPLEQFEAKLQELQSLAEFGFIDEETFARAVQKAKDDLQGALDLSIEQSGQPSALERGSQAAFEAINRRMSQATDPQQRSAKALDELVKLARQADEREAARANETRQELATLPY